ncbi:MAG: adenylate kinase family protein [Candidatus Melainabacteria bacterium]
MSDQNASPLNGKLLLPFVAPPNGGKGTQTKILNERYHLPTFDMGGTFRAIMKTEGDSPLAREIRSYTDQGKLVPVAIVVKVFRKGMEDLAARHPDVPGFILDGFPRNCDQANALAALAAEWGARIPLVFYLNVPLDVVKIRSLTRRFSADGARVYSVADDAPPKLKPASALLDAGGSPVNDELGYPAYRDDETGEPLVIRKDDMPDVVEKRLVEYAAETNPLIDAYRTSGQLCEIDGNQSVDAVTRAIENAIQPVLAGVPA